MQVEDLLKPPPTTGHLVWDAVMWLIVLILGSLEILRRLGLISPLGNGNRKHSANRVGELGVNEWEERLRHELRDEFDSFSRRLGEYHQRSVDQLEQIQRRL